MLKIEKIHVAFIEPIGGHGGNLKFNLNSIKAINKSRIFYSTLYTCDEAVDETVRENVNVVTSYKGIFDKRKPKYIRGLNYVKGTLYALRDAKLRNSKIAHFHIYNWNAFEYMNLFLSKKFFKFKTVATIHDIEPLSDLSGKISIHKYYRFVKLLDGIVFPTKYAYKEFLHKINIDILKEKVLDIIYALDFDFSFNKSLISKFTSRDILNLPKDRKIVLFFGQIKKVKGLDILLKALSKLVFHEPKILLVIAGRTWKDNYLTYKEIIHSNHLEPFVEERIYFIEENDVPHYFRAADVIVLPYKKIYNSGVLLRAMGYNIPIIASDLEPFREFISNGENGILFKSGDPEDLAEKLLSLLNDKESLLSISEAEKRFMKKNFNIESIAHQYERFYKNVLSI